MNPKTLLLTVAGAAAIAGTGIDAGEQAISLAVFLVIGALGPAAPVAIYFALGERSRALLDELKTWMAAHNAGILAVIMLVIGAKLLGDGIAGLRSRPGCAPFDAHPGSGDGCSSYLEDMRRLVARYTRTRSHWQTRRFKMPCFARSARSTDQVDCRSVAP